MKRLLIFLFPLFSFSFAEGQEDIVGFQPEIQPYIEFIKKQNQSPLNYVLDKFDSNDVVVFGERDHRDITQYYFIEDLINQPEFYEKVGVIYTEAGSSNFNDTLNSILQNYNLNDKELEKQLLEVYRDISYQAFWANYNFFYLWKTVFQFNKTHPDFALRIEMLSPPFNWNEIRDTTSCRLKTEEVEKNYDSFMANYFLQRFSSRQELVRNKALVIMNYPHSLKKWTSKANITYEKFFGAFINRQLPGKVCAIIVNPYTINFQPVADGKWDAAFKFHNYPKIGFDFINSPFGKDTFDVWPVEKGILSYQDLYDGMIFINPTNSVENVIGIPGFIDKNFADEYLRRIKLRMLIYTKKEYKTSKISERIYCNNKRSFSVYEDVKQMWGKNPDRDFDKQINQWLIFKE
jgi:hypothetical protein